MRKGLGISQKDGISTLTIRRNRHEGKNKAQKSQLLFLRINTGIDQ